MKRMCYPLRLTGRVDAPIFLDPAWVLWGPLFNNPLFVERALVRDCRRKEGR